MDYNYETLDAEPFQKLCQAILSAKFPNVQCLPVGQPDGGRDAVRRNTNGGFIAYQVKFSRDPNAKDEREALVSLIAAEGAKVDRLRARGATEYHFFSNVAGTAHIDNGSIDRANTILTEKFGIPAFCWWRGEIDRALDSLPDIKWSYPQILRGTDVLQLLVEAGLPKNIMEKYQAYARKQYLDDREVKFRQAQLQSELLDLFIDIPLSQSRQVQPAARPLSVSDDVLHAEGDYPQVIGAYDHRRRFLAAKWLLARSAQSLGERLVLEGAPGQGKSTVTQYVCQIHRMRLLAMSTELERVPKDHLTSFLRIPFRVDLRDFASWLNGFNPYAMDTKTPRPQGALDSLEFFLAHQVHVLSGGLSFDVDDLSRLFSNNHILIVLDGFDEVADLRIRKRLLAQLREAAARLDGGTKSLQAIVTSRPAAFALAPGFPEREWAHYSLTSMERGQIDAYADRWLTARAFGARDSADFKGVLLDRLSQPHIGSLAQNPMQLAILLTLISTKGRSLPDKRTALYDSYMDLFFGREAEKDTTVRNNRDLLVKLHQYVAWIIHAETEGENGTGSVTQERLIDLVRCYIRDVGHEDTEIESLFTGMVERVGALVSRVQGRYEFEVQPLREYFTGRYLYESAPYSPPGDEKGGTKPDRFRVMARHPFWVNVVRFYSGCYSSGELASLADELSTLMEDENFGVLPLARLVALMLLADYVFTQEPRTVREVADLLADPHGFSILLGSINDHNQSPIALPERCGREIIAAAAEREISTSSRPDVISRASTVLIANSSPRRRLELWQGLSRSKPGLCSIYSDYLQFTAAIDTEEAERLFKQHGSQFVRALLTERRWGLLNGDIYDAAVNFILDRGLVDISASYNAHQGVVGLDYFSALFAPYFYYHLFEYRHVEIPAKELWSRYGAYWSVQMEDRVVNSGPEGPKVSLMLEEFDQAMDLPATLWGSSLAPWNAVVERGRTLFGERRAIQRLAVLAAGIRSKEAVSSEFGDFNSAHAPMCERARHARLKSGNISWWRSRLSDVATDTECTWFLLNFLTWASARTISAHAEEAGSIVDGLSDDDWRWLADSLTSLFNVAQPTRIEEAAIKSIFKMTNSFRVLVILARRAPESLAQRLWSELLGEYEGEDTVVSDFCEQMAYASVHTGSHNTDTVLASLRKLSKSSRDENARYLYQRRLHLSEAQALHICQNPLLYPLSITSVAQDVLARSVLRDTPAVSAVATRDSWFPPRAPGRG